MQMKVMNGKLASIQQCAGLLSFNLGGTGTGSEKPQLSRHFENLNGKFASHGNRRWRDWRGAAQQTVWYPEITGHVLDIPFGFLTKAIFDFLQKLNEKN